jgi:hypothetical protein
MIGLNKIGLNQVQLNRLRLNAPFPAYGKMVGGGGSGDGFPQLPGDVTRWHFGGLTNEMMAAMDDPRIEDADHKGRFLSFKNFAWGGMSGVGGYNQNFNTWVKSASRIDATVIGSSVFKINAIRQSRIIQLYYQSEGSQQPFTIPAFVIKVSGLIDNQKLRYQHYKDGVTAYFEINVDGIYNLPSFDFLAGGSVYGFIFDKIQESCDITIEILPLYPGALVFDGVDDYGTCDNFPILTKEKGYTVVALRQYLVEKSTAYLTANGDSISNTSFIFEGNNYKDTWNFGRATTIQASRILATQTSKQYDGVKLNIGSNTEGSNLLQVGKWSKSYSNVAIWELVYLDHDATEEELTKIKDYFVKTYPWLFPDQAWTVTGKTNEDGDRATIANITGNGNDLVLSNFGFAEGSGYNEEGEYAGYLVTDGVDDKVVSAESIAFTDTWTIITDAIFLGEKVVSAGILVKDIFGVSNLMEYGRVEVSVKGGVLLKVPTPSIKAICSDGRIYDADWNEYQAEPGTIKVSEGTLIIGMWYNGIQFCSIAFKNLGIYNNQLLSKDDCIKSYNYLQTLKAK